MLYRILTFILFLSFVTTLEAQGTIFNAQSSVGSKMIVKALPYSNGINKYYFDKPAIQKLADYLKENPSVYIEINCFADFSDTPMMNLMATADQAIDIKNYLINLGVKGSRLKTIGNGDMFPIHNQDKIEKMSDLNRKAAELENRRIEIKIIKK